MKYVVFEVKIDDMIRRIPIIFPNGLVHSMVAEALTKYKDDHGDLVIDGKPVSAGECVVDVESTHGSSITLKLEADAEDRLLINYIDYTTGIV